MPRVTGVLAVVADLMYLTFADHDYSNTYGCEWMDGGNWKLVRHVSAEENGYHPATDRLSGTDVYGTYDGNAQSLESWSIDFSSEKYNQFMFAYGDCSDYIITTKDAIIGEYYDANDDRCILNSKNSYNPHYLSFYNQEYASTPLITSKDFTECVNEGCLLYAEGNYGANGQREHMLTGMRQHKGSNVWIRQKNGEIRSCCNYDKYCSVNQHNGLVSFDSEMINLNEIPKDSDNWVDYVKQCYYANARLNVPIRVSGLHEKCTYDNSKICVNEVMAYITDGVKTIGISFPYDGSTPMYKNSYMYNGTPAIGTRTLNGGKYSLSVSNGYLSMSFPLKDGSGEIGMVRFSYAGSSLQLYTTDCLSKYMCGECPQKMFFE